ncbi:MAG: peptidase M28, partial [Salinimicrobium sp.]
PNSLVYLMDEDTGKATWNTYDDMADDWTAPFFSDASKTVAPDARFSSKYGTRFKKSMPAPVITLPEPFIKVEKVPATTEEEDRYAVKIAPNRDINRIELYADKSIKFKNMTVNGKAASNLQPGVSRLNVFSLRWRDRLLEYYPVNRDTLRLEMSMEKGQHPEVTLYEAAYSLLNEPQLKLKPRDEDMIPRPFVLNDAVVVKRSFVLK